MCCSSMPPSTSRKASGRTSCCSKHIAKIVDTYQHRKEEPRYARRVGMDEIEKNDFNLNISRYVSTAQTEEEIDLMDVNQELKALEQKISAAKQRHDSFLEDLGLPLLP